jgi:hypothetical protein
MPDEVGGTYYVVDPEPCPRCGGVGCVDLGQGLPPEQRWRECPLCDARVYEQGGSETHVAATLGDFMAVAWKPDDTYPDSPFRADLLSVIPGLPPYEIPGRTEPSHVRMPLVLNEDYFKYGIGLGVWHQRDKPMLFYRTDAGNGDLLAEGAHATTDFAGVQPDWGFLAVASARVAFPAGPGDRVAKFEFADGSADVYERDLWLESTYNLYAGDIRPRLWPIKKQIADDAFEEDIITAGERLTPELKDTSATYLFDVLTRADRGAYGETNWRRLRKQQTDARIAALLRQVGRSDFELGAASPRDGGIEFRRRSRLDVRSPRLEEIVKH